MTQVALLLTNKYRLLSVAAILDVFDTVNSYYEANGQEALFNVSILYAANSSNEVPVFNQYVPQPLNASGKQDLVLIPAFATQDVHTAVQENLEFIPWLRQQHQKGVELASFCTGAFLLGASGLLNGKNATTHIHACTSFAANYPDVYLRPSEVVTYDHGIYTSGGATSTFHLLLRLIHNYANRETAIRVAKVFAIDMNRGQQSYFGTFVPPRDHGDELVAQTQLCIENSYNKAATVEDILQQIPASRRNIERRFKMATGNTLIEYLQKTRIEVAKKLLEQTNQSILEIMLNSGYNDLKAFRQLFKKNSGMTPKDYRDKFKARVA
ncbi:transcriptional regulator GlxA family with amidase domain [Pedobacter africanus]|uniref:Transcriptional regulator GlxA family with amidase domain n=1 Tax=Pedobacter africanus TaxID=151894 RepID=A0ACC6KWF9_9SPHI|nr:helix-turn-helix domain-containing protein [Pedobacter africanus]MDR6783495.1 transcriptional regulator GlxA family with amidase domain [Pedobacter africanus]